MGYVLEYIDEIISFVVGAISGSLLTVYFKSQRASGSATVIDQSESRAGGDIVGRDKVEKN